jgi:hypothetical protein
MWTSSRAEMRRDEMTVVSQQRVESPFFLPSLSHLDAPRWLIAIDDNQLKDDLFNSVSLFTVPEELPIHFSSFFSLCFNDEQLFYNLSTLSEFSPHASSCEEWVDVIYIF